ncbi:MAG: hypothetical protein Q4P20_07125 [Eubacteriales bacterium]|nr:hypothetical protein [Eubacteriales bacterium]
MKRKRWLALLGVLCLCCTGALASETDEEQANDYIQYKDGYATVSATAASIQDKPDTVIGTKTYSYHGLDGEVRFTYSVSAAFTFDGKKSEQTGNYTTFYVSDGWEKQTDDCNGKAIFTDGRRKRKIDLTISCSKTGTIS